MSHTQRPFALGQSDFREFRRAGAYYVDKSLLIREVITNSFQTVLLPRPRRFGKTLNLSMLRYFFERSPESRADLFDGLAIRHDPLFATHQGRYPVIYLTFKDAKAASWEEFYEGIRWLIIREVERHLSSLQNADLPRSVRKSLDAIINQTASKREYEDILFVLSEQLSRMFGEHVVILIDEYDTPIHSAYTHGYYEETISFLRNFLSAGLKDNRYLFKGAVTGILRIAKESIFSGLNNLGVYTLLAREFRSAFGFTESEIRHLLADYELADRYAEVAGWYNGYLFGGDVIYNPWSVLNYIASQDRQPRPYWVNTGSNDLLESLLTRGGRELRGELTQLLAGQSVTKPITETIVMRDLPRRDDLVWSFFLFSGYLKPVDLNVERNWYDLRIPNAEVRYAYEELIERWFAETLDLSHLKDMLHALQQGDIARFERTLRQIALEIMSYHDLSGEPEKVYQALVLGMLVWLSGVYDIRTNRESGLGRYDILLKPKTPEKSGIILEFKQVYEQEQPETVLERALQQIADRQYVTEFTAAGVRDVLQIAVAFRGKELWLRARQDAAART